MDLQYLLYWSKVCIIFCLALSPRRVLLDLRPFASPVLVEQILALQVPPQRHFIPHMRSSADRGRRRLLKQIELPASRCRAAVSALLVFDNNTKLFYGVQER